MTGQDPTPLLIIVAIIAGAVISAIITQRALKHLNSEGKARLLDSFSRYRVFNSAFPLVIFGVWFMTIVSPPRWRSPLTVIFALSYLAVSTAVSLLSYRKMKSLRMPAGYIKNYMLGLAIQYIGAGFAFAALLAQTVL